MQRIKGDPPSYAGSFMPPATTRRFPDQPTPISQGARIVPPFVPPHVTDQPEPDQAAAAEPERIEEAAESDVTAFADFLAGGETADAGLVAEGEPSQASWESLVEEEGIIEPEEIIEPEDIIEREATAELEGIVEPAFMADADEFFRDLSEQAAQLVQREEFPLEAFIVPEQTQHVPSGLEGQPPVEVQQPPAAVTSLAERLEKLSHRLRVEETDAVVRRLAAGDRLDSLLAGLLAGYLAGKSEQP